jgi:hypothetical protein
MKGHCETRKNATGQRQARPSVPNRGPIIVAVPGTFPATTIVRGTLEFFIL